MRYVLSFSTKSKSCQLKWMPSFLLLILLNLTSVAQSTIFSPANFVVNGDQEATQVVPADIDGDGDTDLVTAEKNGVGWYENEDGLGHFEPLVLISVSSNPVRFIEVTDLDGDGDLDIVAATTLDHTIAWYENEDGAGTFGQKKIISVETEPLMSGYIIDIDGDGDLDLIASSNGYTLAAWYENVDGAGSFGPKKTIYSGQITAPTTIYAGDIDGDGDMDVVCASRYPFFMTLAWFRNEDGEGNFSAPISFSDQASGLYPVITADVDGDGDLDILSSNKLDWYENLDGLGSFGPQQVLASPGDLGAISIHVADLDNDGDLDVVSGRGDSVNNAITWNKNDGQGGFGNYIQFSMQPYEQAKSVRTADIDNDGDLDVIAALTSGTLVWYENLDGLGAFGPINWVSKQAREVKMVQAEDLDNDGDLDLVSASQYDDKVAWYENEDGNATFTRQRIVSLSVDKAATVRAGDIDGDGDLDLLYGSLAGDKVFWNENLDGLGNYGEAVLIYTQPYGPNDLFPADIDGDGDLDVVSTRVGMYADNLRWYENETPTEPYWNFQEISISPGFDPTLIQAADIDGDGDLDILGSETGVISSDMYWFRNLDGNGNFSNGKAPGAFQDKPNASYAADLDSDGDLDILSCSQDDDKIFWFENTDGLGSFSGSMVISTDVNYPTSVYAADLDNDGDMDILSASRGDDKLAWYENLDGNGTFGIQHVISATGIDFDFVRAADLDGDGDLDVFSSTYFDSHIVWFENFLLDPSLSGKCFYDKNENKVRDQGETTLFNQRVVVSPDAKTSFTNQSGSYRFIVENGDYTVTALPDGIWSLTTDPSSFQVTYDGVPVQGLDFGFIPSQSITEVSPSLTVSPTRCGFKVPFWVEYKNTGTADVTGWIALELDALTSLVSAAIQPDSIQGNTLFWRFEGLSPSYSNTIQLVLQMPDVSFLGDTVSFSTTSYLIDNMGNLQPGKVYEAASVINCSYDPNDKLVEPTGSGSEFFTLFDKELEYTVRFQNTGTDTAFTVRIEDQLDANLDWATFQPVSGSHHYEASLDADGKIVFVFEGILLPDSSVNEPGSHGFVKYRIQPLSGLPDFTAIHNTANIYFDFNPAIVTNTTLNTLVPLLPAEILNQQATCLGNNDGAFTASPINGTAPYHFTLNNGINNQTGLFQDLPAGSYSLTVTDAEGYTQEQEVQIEELALPLVDLGSDTTLCSTDLPFPLSPGNSFTSYLWTDGSTDSVFNISDLQSSSYGVTVTDDNGCSNNDEVFIVVDICDAVGELTSSDFFQLSPNPAIDKVLLTIQLPESISVDIIISNSAGQIVYRQSWALNETENTVLLDVSNYPKELVLH
jgi:uncharacterized repeat protein (TIGR01451 family)